ncbi:MAG: hypothetical protein CMN28_13285 [Salinisphaeraceae bacterium]|jgi:uncharacterized protein YdgA (DUF945 family)|nr:hypothetical protein [Salinisphaeraceae bacterium]
MLQRIAIIVIVALVFSVLAAPALGGWYLSRHHDRYAKRMAIPGVLELGPTSIRRGWFRSESLITLVPADRFCRQPPCPPIRLNSVIHHGPLPFTAPGTLSGFLKLARGIVVTTVDYAPILSAFDFSEPVQPLQVSSHIGLDGEVTTEIDMPAMLQEMQGDPISGRLRTDRLTGSLHVPGDRSSVSADMAVPRVKWVGNESGQFDLINLALSASGEGRRGTLIDQQQLEFDSLQIASRKGDALAMQDVAFEVERLPTEPGLVSADVNLRVSQLESRGEQYGPAVLDGRLSNIDIATVNALQREWRALRREQRASATQGADTTETLAGMAMQRIHLAQFLRHSPEIRINRLLLATGQGDVSGELHLRVAPAAADSADSEAATGLTALINRLIGDGELRLPVPLVRQLVGFVQARRSQVGSLPPSRDDVDDRLQRWEEQGLLQPVESENAYLMELALRDGVLSVNGTPRDHWSDLAEEFSQSPR